jgi:hypothetical protein
MVMLTNPFGVALHQPLTTAPFAAEGRAPLG